MAYFQHQLLLSSLPGWNWTQSTRVHSLLTGLRMGGNKNSSNLYYYSFVSYSNVCRPQSRWAPLTFPPSGLGCWERTPDTFTSLPRSTYLHVEPDTIFFFLAVFQHTVCTDKFTPHCIHVWVFIDIIKVIFPDSNSSDVKCHKAQALGALRMEIEWHGCLLITWAITKLYTQLNFCWQLSGYLSTQKTLVSLMSSLIYTQLARRFLMRA